jgi:hypothetical protein
MACRIVRVQGAVFSVLGKSAREDTDQILGVVEEAAREHGAPVVYVVRFPPDAPAPAGEVLHHMKEVIPRAVAACSAYHIVLEGDGFGVAVKRAVLLGLVQLLPRGTVTIYASMGELARRDRRDAPMLEALLARATSDGLASGPSPA